MRVSIQAELDFLLLRILATLGDTVKDRSCRRSVPNHRNEQETISLAPIEITAKLRKILQLGNKRNNQSRHLVLFVFFGAASTRIIAAWASPMAAHRFFRDVFHDHLGIFFSDGLGVDSWVRAGISRTRPGLPFLLQRNISVGIDYRRRTRIQIKIQANAAGLVALPALLRIESVFNFQCTFRDVR